MLYLLSLLFLLGPLLGADNSRPAFSRSSRQGIVLELFTSQGCSSCPAADDLLTRLEADSTIGPYIIPLAHHVDYWDRLGWKDPFSQHELSERQQTYEELVHVPNIYTPQLIINGRSECIGSDERRVRDEITWAMNGAPTAFITLHAQPETASEKTVQLSFTARLMENTSADSVDVWVALFENNRVTRIASGENTGTTIRDNFITRSLTKVDNMPGHQGSWLARQVTLPISSGWDEKNLGAVVFVQDPSSLAIYGATVQPLQ